MSPSKKSVGIGLQNPLQHALARLGLETEDFADMAGPLGVTPKTTIYTQGTLKLHHFKPMVESVYRKPILVVTSLVNQPYILDLVPGLSMMEFLLRQGYDVYTIEWGRPRKEHKELTLEDHVLDRLEKCVAKVVEDTGVNEISVIGYCVGGLLAALYAAANPESPVKNLVCMATPVNSDGLESLKAWMGADFDEEALLAQHGNVPGDWVQNALRALRPFGKLGGAMNLLNNIDNAETVRSNLRMGKWETDNLPFPGGVFRQMVKDFLRDNLLVKGKYPLGAQKLSLRTITVPFLHLLAADDHITPYASSHPLVELIGSRDKEEIVVKGGHVGLVAGRGAQLRMWPALDAWLAPRSL